MKTEDKELLLKDLCSRLPYGVKCVSISDGCIGYISSIESQYGVVTFDDGRQEEIIDIKPYLFPLSNMTEEQKKELCKVGGYEAREEDCGYHSETFYYNMVGHENVFYPDADDIDWLNKNHFDYRGLIEKDLALDATGLNIY